MELKDWFEKGMTYETYKAGMKVNLDNVNSIYDRFQLTEQEKEQLAGVKNKGLRVIVLTEDWCGDAMVNIPILMKIAEEANIDARFLLRDRNLELMDQYLTNGTSRSIPIYIFINEKGEERAVWGPRAPEAQELVDSLRSSLPPKDAEDFQEKQKAMYKQLTKTFLEDEQLWRKISASIIEKINTI